MTSFFVLKESVSYCKENGSKLFTCFLDARQAFDRVWHDGLYYKLHKLGICSHLLKSVVSMHIQVCTAVLCTTYFILTGSRSYKVLGRVGSGHHCYILFTLIPLYNS